MEDGNSIITNCYPGEPRTRSYYIALPYSANNASLYSASWNQIWWTITLRLIGDPSLVRPTDRIMQTRSNGVNYRVECNAFSSSISGEGYRPWKMAHFQSHGWVFSFVVVGYRSCCMWHHNNVSIIALTSCRHDLYTVGELHEIWAFMAIIEIHCLIFINLWCEERGTS